MRYFNLILFILFLGTFFVTSCSLQPASPQVDSFAAVSGGVEPTPAPTILPTLAVTNTNFVSPLSPSETPTQTTSTWSTYTVTDMLAIEYPVGWEIRTVQTIPAKHYFSPPGFNPPETISNEQITLEVYPRALADRDIANPQSWMPNTGGYEAHWLTPIQIEEADGWLFVWGASAEGRLDIESGLWAYAPTLRAIYYSETHELDVRLSVSFDDESTLLAQEIGLAETVAQRYPTFEHMMKSVRFVEPTQP